MKTFDPVDATSKFPICGMPIRLDTYRSCTFQCKYCFANRFLGGNTNFQIGNIISIQNRLKKVFDDKDVENFIFVDQLISNGYTWHCGGMSDPFQPCEQEYHVTRDIINITNDYNINILFSTKADTYYDANLKPDLHAFQLSITNIHNRRDIEPNIPDIESRYKFFQELKEKGFRVGIRIQPFIPGISDLDIFEKFKDADHFVIEGLKIVANNLEMRKEIFDLTGLNKDDFKNMGLLNLKPELRLKYYKPIIQWCQENNKSYSIADNDFHYLGNNKCCCGDILTFGKYTKFNTTYMSHSPNRLDYSLEETLDAVNKENLLQTNCKHQFFSGSQGDCITFEDFYRKKFNMKSSIFSPKFFYITDESKALIDINSIKSDDFNVIQKNTINKIINHDIDIKTTEEIPVKAILLKSIPTSIISNHYYGWECPICEKISSPAMPICYFCNSQNFNQDEIIKYIPYWTSIPINQENIN